MTKKSERRRKNSLSLGLINVNDNVRHYTKHIYTHTYIHVCRKCQFRGEKHELASPRQFCIVWHVWAGHVGDFFKALSICIPYQDLQKSKNLYNELLSAVSIFKSKVMDKPCSISFSTYYIIMISRSEPSSQLSVYLYVYPWEVSWEWPCRALQ